MSEIDPADQTHNRPSIPEPFDPDALAIAASDVSPKKAEREGLPPGYRMRADAHYVEALTSRRSDRTESSRAPAKRTLEAVDPDPAGAGDRREARERAERMIAQLTEDIATIESAASLLAGETSKMARRANVDVIRAQAWRAGWLLKANAVVDGSHRLHVRPRPLGFVLGQLRAGFASEARLTGTTVHVHTADWNAVVAVDEQALIAALAGAVVSTLGLLGQSEGATIKVTAHAAGGELRTVDIAQEELAVTPAVSARFFDAAWTERPGGWMAGLGAAAAKLVAEEHGGSAAFLAGERFGSVLKLSFAAQA